MENLRKIPIEGYARCYRHSYTDLIDREITEYLIGEICENKDDLPDRYEYSCDVNKYIGIVKVKIEIDELK